MHDWAQSFTCVVSAVVQIVIVPLPLQTGVIVVGSQVGKQVCEIAELGSARSVHDAVVTLAAHETLTRSGR